MGSQRQPLTSYRVEARRGAAWETLKQGSRYEAMLFYNECIEQPRRVLEVSFDSAHRQHCTVVRDSDSDGYAATYAARNQVQEAAQ